MSSNTNLFSEAQPPFIGNLGKSRKLYCKPQLVELGDLRTLTLGASPTGFQDSSGALRSEFPGGAPAPGFPQPDGSILLPDGSILLPDGTLLPPP